MMLKKKEVSLIDTFTYDFIHPYISHRIYSHIKFHALFMYSHVNNIHAFLKKKFQIDPVHSSMHPHSLMHSYIFKLLFKQAKKQKKI